MEYFSQIYRIYVRTAHAKQSRRQPFQKWRANRVFHVESPSNPAPVDGKFLAYSPRIDASCMRKNVQNHRWPKRRPTHRARRPRDVSESGTTARHVSLRGHVRLRRATGIPAIEFPCAHVRITVTCDRDTAAYLCDRIWQNASHASIVACDTHTKHVPQRTSWYTDIFRSYFSIGSTLTCEHMDKMDTTLQMDLYGLVMEKTFYRRTRAHHETDLPEPSYYAQRHYFVHQSL